MHQHCPISWFSWYMFNVTLQLNTCSCFRSFLKSGFWYANFLKVILWLWYEAFQFIKVKWQRVNAQVKQVKRVTNVIKKRIQIFDCNEFSNNVFRTNRFNEFFSIRDCWFCYISKFDLFSDNCLLKTEYGRNI